MLQSIRDGIQGWVSSLIIGIICVPFAFWGVTSYFSGDSNVAVAKVEGTEISQQDFQRAYQSRYQQEQRRMGSNPDAIDEDALKREVIETLVSRQALDSYVAEAGYDISDEQLVQTLRQNPYMQEDGQFSPTRYGQLLAALGMDAPTYEASLRKSLSLGQLQQGIAGSADVSEDELSGLLALQTQIRDASSVTIAAADLRDSVEVSEQEIKDWYDANMADYWSEERVRVDYVELSSAKLQSRIEISDADIAERYEEDKASYVVPEQRKASHILVRNNDDDEAARSKIESLKAEIEAGADFAEVAKANSDDPGSAAQGGDLGLVPRGMMVAPFEDALFDLPEAGALSDIVKTQFGYHLIQLNEIQAEKGKTLEEAKAEIETTLRNEKAQDLFVELVEQMGELAYQTPDSLKDVSEALELEVQTSPWFTEESGTGIARAPEVRDVAFSELVIAEAENSEVIELGDDRAVVLRKQEHQPSEQQTLEQVSEQIEAALIDKKARELAAEKTKILLAAVEAGSPLTEVAAAQSLDVTQHLGLARDSSEINPMVRNDIFALSQPEEGEVTFGSTELANGNQVIYTVSAVKQADLDEAALAAKKQALESRLKSQRGRAEMLALLRELRDASDVTVFNDRL